MPFDSSSGEPQKVYNLWMAQGSAQHRYHSRPLETRNEDSSRSYTSYLLFVHRTWFQVCQNPRSPIKQVLATSRCDTLENNKLPVGFNNLYTSGLSRLRHPGWASDDADWSSWNLSFGWALPSSQCLSSYWLRLDATSTTQVPTLLWNYWKAEPVEHHDRTLGSNSWRSS